MLAAIVSAGLCQEMVNFIPAGDGDGSESSLDGLQIAGRGVGFDTAHTTTKRRDALRTAPPTTLNQRNGGRPGK
jgi:hypothetical protein